MTSRQPAPELERSISAALARPQHVAGSPRTGSILCAGVAALAISPLPATALTLGELAAGSQLGQPLKATIPVRLAAGEMLDDRCVSRGDDGRDLDGPQSLRFRVPSVQGPGNFEIAVTTARPLVEPMYEIAVRIDCQGTPRLVRHYVLMLDLPGLAPILAPRSEPRQPAATPADRQQTAPTAPARNTTPRPRLARSRDPITPGSSYRVREGDTLSTIAARITGRPANSTWQLADRIFSANPSAFIRNDPDLIKLGYEIRIPELGAPAEAASQPTSNFASAMPATEPAPATPQNRSTASLPPTSMIDTTEARPSANTGAELPATEPVTAAQASQSLADMPELREPFVVPEASDAPAADGVAPAESDAPADEAKEPPPVVISETRAAQVSPLLAVLLGVLLGVALSVGLLRTSALERVSELLRRSQRGQTAKTDSFIDTDEWLDPTDTEVGSLPVRAPAEETYVVEVAAPEPSEVFEAEGTGDAFDPDLMPVAERTASDMPAVAAAADEDLDADIAEVEPSAEFAEVFTDAMEGLPSEPDLPLDDPFAETAATVEQPHVGSTEELPHFNSSGLGFDEDAETEELASLDADDDGFEDADLDALESAAGDETRLSSTLKEALSLLEQDYDEELTASQVVDRKAIEDALSDDEAAELDRKLGS